MARDVIGDRLERRPDDLIGFLPHFTPHPLDGDRVLLLSEERAFMLSGVIYAALEPLLHGDSSYRDLQRKLGSKIAPVELRKAVVRLIERGYVGFLDAKTPHGTQALWSEMGLSPADLSARVGGTKLAIIPAGRGQAASQHGAALLRNEAIEAGFHIAEPEQADLVFVMVDDYQQRGLLDLANELRSAGRRWMPIKPGGRTTWFGPVFEPGQAPCMSCLSRRLQENRAGDHMVHGDLHAPRPARAEVGFAIAAARGLMLLALTQDLARQPGPTDLHRHVVTVDLMTLQRRLHRLRPDQVCPVCATPLSPEARLAEASRPVILQARPKVASGDGSRMLPAERALGLVEHLVSPLTGIVQGLHDVSPDPDQPVFTAEQAVPLAPRANRRMGRPDGAAGKGRSLTQAHMSCIAEAVERYCSGSIGIEPRCMATIAELGEDAVDPRRLLNFADEQYDDREAWNARHGVFQIVPQRFDPTREIAWSPAWSLTRERVRWVPSLMSFFQFPAEPDHEFAYADSNGCAAGSCLEEAILQGLLELIERDAFAVFWYNRIRRPAVDLEAFDDDYFHANIAKYEAHGRRLVVLDLTHDLGVSTVAACAVDRTGRIPAIGLGAHLEPRVAISRAISEANQSLSLEVTGAVPDDPDHAHWLAECTVHNQPYLLPLEEPARGPRDMAAIMTDDIRDDVRTLLERLREHDLEVLVMDLTRPDTGLCVARTLVPDMRHFWAHLGPGRLYDVPVQLGWLERPRSLGELNPMPFFL